MLSGHAAIVTHKTMPRFVWDLIPIVASARADPALAALIVRNGNHDAAPPPVSLPSGADALKRALDTPRPEKENLRIRPGCDQRCSGESRWLRYACLAAGRLVPAHSV